MLPNPQDTAYLVTFTEEMLNGKLYFLYSDYQKYLYQITLNDSIRGGRTLFYSWLVP